MSVLESDPDYSGQLFGKDMAVRPRDLDSMVLPRLPPQGPSCFGVLFSVFLFPFMVGSSLSQ